MATLGAVFPEGFLRQQLVRQLAPGVVIKLRELMDDGEIKEKRFVVVKVDENTICCVINSQINRFIESRPALARLADQSLLASDPSAGGKHIQAARASDGSYAFVYVPASRTFAVHMDKLAGDRAKAWWFNPRNGAATLIGEFAHSGAAVQEFTPPDAGENVDWVLVIDNVASHFSVPARKQSGRKD